MTKKIYLTIIWSIALLVIVFSCGIRFAGWFSNTGTFRSSSNHTNVEDVGSGALSDTVSVDEFTNVKVSVGACELKFATSNDEYKVEYSATKEKLVPKIGVKDGTLYVNQDNIKLKDATGTDSLKLTVTIYVPTNTTLENIDLDIGAGDLNLENLSGENFDVDLGAGDFDLKNSTFENISVDCGAGDIFMENNTFDSLDIDAGTGDVKLNCLGDLSQYTFDIDNGVGETRVGGEKVKNEYKSGSGAKKIDIDLGVGEVNIIQ